MSGNICGYVVDATNGRPIPHIRITETTHRKMTISARPITEFDLPERRINSFQKDLNSYRATGEPKLILTDDEGWFAIDGLREGEHVVQAWTTESQPVGKTTVQVFDNALTDVTIEVCAERNYPGIRTCTTLAGSVRGRVVHANNGKPLINATVIVVRGTGPAPDVAPLTDQHGNFLVEGLNEGKWMLRAIGSNGETGGKMVHVHSHSVTHVSIQVQRTVGELLMRSIRGKSRARANKNPFQCNSDSG